MQRVLGRAWAKHFLIFLGSIAQNEEQKCRANERCEICPRSQSLVMHMYARIAWIRWPTRGAHWYPGRCVRQADNYILCWKVSCTFSPVHDVLVPVCELLDPASVYYNWQPFFIIFCQTMPLGPTNLPCRSIYHHCGGKSRMIEKVSRVSGFEAGLAVFMCWHRVVLVSFVFHLSSLSLPCSCAHRLVPVSFPFTCACWGIARWVLLLLFSGYSYSASFVFVLVLLKWLRLSRQAVKFWHVALFECFSEPGWTTTSRCDKGKKRRGTEQKKKTRED